MKKEKMEPSVVCITKSGIILRTPEEVSAFSRSVEWPEEFCCVLKSMIRGAMAG